MNKFDKLTVDNNALKGVMDMGPDYAHEKLSEFLRHAKVLMENIETLYIEEQAVMAFLGVDVRLSITTKFDGENTYTLAEAAIGPNVGPSDKEGADA